MIDNLKFRQVKILMNNGEWARCEKKIRTEEELHAYVESLTTKEAYPFKVYISNTLWLSPEILKGQKLNSAGWQTLSNVFLGGDLLFDMDKAEHDLERVRLDTLKLVKFMQQKHPEYKLNKIQFSGQKGLHLIYTEEYQYQQQNPIKRQEEYQTRRLKLLATLPELATLDKNGITEDPRRIYKAEGFIDHSSGIMVSEIKLSTLQKKKLKDIIKILAHTQATNPKGLNDKRYRDNIAEGLQLEQQPPALYFKAVKNNVFGTKGRYSTFLFFDKEKYNEKRLLKVQEQYSLGSLHLLENDKLTIALSLKPLEYKRILKVMRASKSKYSNQFSKYHYLNLHTSSLVNNEGEEIKPGIKYLKTLPGINTTISKPHLQMLQQLNPALETPQAELSGGRCKASLIELKHSNEERNHG